MEENERKAKLKRLRAIRRGNRGVVTKLEKEVIEILETTPINYDSISRLNVLNQQLEGKLNTLKRNWGECYSNMRRRRNQKRNRRVRRCTIKDY